VHHSNDYPVFIIVSESWNLVCVILGDESKKKIGSWEEILERLWAKFLPSYYYETIFGQFQNLKQNQMSLRE
jgi:hypothetical protein